MSKPPNYINLTLSPGDGILRDGKILVDSEVDGYTYEVHVEEIIRIEVYEDEVKVRIIGTQKRDLIKKPPIFVCGNVGWGMFEED